MPSAVSPFHQYLINIANKWNDDVKYYKGSSILALKKDPAALLFLSHVTFDNKR